MSVNDPFDQGLRRRMEARLKEEFEIAESDAMILAARRKKLSDLAWEASQAGQVVRVTVGKRRLEGLPVYARNDLMTLRCRHGKTEVRLTGIDALMVTSTEEEGRPETQSIGSFLSRMGLLQLTDEDFEVVCIGGEPTFRGRIGHVARDHMAVITAIGQVNVALARLAYVIHQPSSRNRMRRF